MKMPIKKPGGEDMEAMDALMAGPAGEPDADDAAAAPVEPAEPRVDPAELVAGIQAQLDELAQLLAG
jgi:hypothetical protein